MPRPKKSASRQRGAAKERGRRATSSTDASIAILRAAERLFAERGVDNVSLREVTAAANQKNNSAAAYYYGDKLGLIDAILAKHCRDVHGQFDAMLDLVEGRPETDLRRLVEVLVLPVVRKLDDPDGGREFIHLSAQLAVSPAFPLLDRPVASAPAATRLMAAMLPLSRLPSETIIFRMMQVPMFLYGSLVNYMRLGDAAPARPLVVDDLIDGLTSLMSGAAPGSGRG